MNFLVVGLGSMGKRRVRNLLALGNAKDKIFGFDCREDRRQEAQEKYGVTTFADFQSAINGSSADLMIISTPPDQHMKYADLALEYSVHAFIEASVVDADKIKALASKAKQKGIYYFPSCTMKFFPGPKRIKSLIESAVIGNVLSIQYHVGQYLPSWHPWEDISEFYVSNRETGGAREIVPFELTWLNSLFGAPQPIACLKDKKGDFEADIDDIYHALIRYENGELLNLTVDVLAQPVAVRSMRIVGSKGIIEYDGEINRVRYIQNEKQGWIESILDKGSIEKDYIYSEEPYIDEVKAVVDAVSKSDPSLFPNTLEDDVGILNTLYALEHLSAIQGGSV